MLSRQNCDISTVSPKKDFARQLLISKETYWAMSHSPDNKDNGLILWNNVLQFHEVVRMEWGPWKRISNRVNTWNYDKKVGVLLLTNFVEREAQHYFFRQLQSKAFKSKAITLKITWNNSGLTMGLKSHCKYLFYVGSE